MKRTEFPISPRYHFKQWTSLVLFLIVSLSWAGCNKGLTSQDTRIKQLVTQYFDALENANIEEYINLFHPSIKHSAETALSKIGLLEITDWNEQKKKYGWNFIEKDRKLDAEISPLVSVTLAPELTASIGPDAGMWKITFKYYNRLQLRERRSHILVDSKDGPYLYLPPDMEEQVYTRLSDLRVFCAEMQKSADVFRRSMQAIFSAPIPDQIADMQHIRYPLYIEAARSEGLGCIFSLGASQVVVHPEIAIGTEILPGTYSIAERLLLEAGIEEGERLESPAELHNRTGASPLFSHLGEGVKRNTSWPYTPWVFTKEIAYEPSAVVLLHALDPSEPRSSKEKTFISIAEAIIRDVTINTVARYRIEKRRVGFYTSQSGKPRDAYEITLHAEIIDTNDFTIRRKSVFHAFPPSFQSFLTGFRSSYDMVYEDFGSWLGSLN